MRERDLALRLAFAAMPTGNPKTKKFSPALYRETKRPLVSGK